MLDAGLEAVGAPGLISRHLRREGDAVSIGDCPYDVASGRVLVLGAGKASAALAAAVETALEGLPLGGIVLTRRGYAVPTRWIEVREGGHPIPDEGGMVGAKAILDVADTVTGDDLVLCLFSGGGSALLSVPPPGIPLRALQRLTEALLRCGATIEEINTVRRHLSVVQGGRLAARIGHARVVTLLLSAVPGDAPEAIASGPTVPDPTTFADAREVLVRHGIWPDIAEEIRVHLDAGVRGAVRETPKPGDPIFERTRTLFLGNVWTAVGAALAAGEARGFDCRELRVSILGEAREVGARLARTGMALRDCVPTPTLLVGGGETTVTVTGEGRGGRNQELALAAAIALDGSTGVTVASLATDGTDGPTDAAGGIVDGGTADRARAAGLDPRKALATNDALPLLRAAGDLLVTGPTGTNVADIVAVLVSPGEGDSERR